MPIVATHYGGKHPRIRIFNRLTPNDPYMGRTAPLTSKRCILYIYIQQGDKIEKNEMGWACGAYG